MIVYPYSNCSCLVKIVSLNLQLGLKFMNGEILKLKLLENHFVASENNSVRRGVPKEQYPK